MGGCGSKGLNLLVKIHIKLFVLQTCKNVLTHIIHKWGGHISPFHDALRLHRILTVRDGHRKIHFFKDFVPKESGNGWVGVQSPKSSHVMLTEKCFFVQKIKTN